VVPNCPITDADQLWIISDRLMLDPDEDFSIALSGNDLVVTLSAPVQAYQKSFRIFWGQRTTTIPADAVGTAQVVDGAITNDKVAAGLDFSKMSGSLVSQTLGTNNSYFRSDTRDANVHLRGAPNRYTSLYFETDSIPKGFVQWDDINKRFDIGTNDAAGNLRFRTGAGTTAFSVNSNRDVTFTGNVSTNSIKADGGVSTLTANSTILDYNGGSRLLAIGGNATTAGTFGIYLTSTVGSPYIAAQTFDTEGNALFSSSVSIGSGSGMSVPNVNADNLVIEGASNTGLTIASGVNHGSHIFFADNGSSNSGGIVYDHPQRMLQFRTGGNKTALDLTSDQSAIFKGNVYAGNKYVSSGVNPRFHWNETDGIAEKKQWDLIASAGQLRGRLINDANTLATDWLQVRRNGMAVDKINLLGATGIYNTAGDALTTDGRVTHKFNGLGDPRFEMTNEGSVPTLYGYNWSGTSNLYYGSRQQTSYTGFSLAVAPVAPLGTHAWVDVMNINGKTNTTTFSGDVAVHGIIPNFSKGSAIHLKDGSGTVHMAVGGGIGGADRNMFIANSSNPPSVNPSGGGYMYALNGALYWRGSNGTITNLAAA